jgi:hypothetical protein
VPETLPAWLQSHMPPWSSQIEALYLVFVMS